MYKNNYVHPIKSNGYIFFGPRSLEFFPWVWRVKRHKGLAPWLRNIWVRTTWTTMQIVRRPRPGFTSSHLSKRIVGLGRYTLLYKIWYTPLYIYIKAPCVFLDRMNISNFGTPSNWRFSKIPSIERKDSSQITLDRGTKWAHSRWSCSEPRYCNRNLEHFLFPEIDNWTLPKKLFIDWWMHSHMWSIHIQMWKCQTLQTIVQNSDSCRWKKRQTRFFPPFVAMCRKDTSRKRCP